jgi:cytochrome c biogenesis protein CcmG/thiol:disulfide interchange protein DsbE
VLLGIDVRWDGLQPAQRFVQEFQVAYPVGRDASGAIGDAYGVQATPTTYFIDKKGILVHRVEGEIEPAELTRQIESLLKE